MSRHTRRWETIFIKLVNEGVALGMFRSDIPVGISVNALFGMLNWHYLWFREGKGITRDKYARMVTGLILAGADEAMAATEDTATGERPAAKKIEKTRPSLAGRAV